MQIAFTLLAIAMMAYCLIVRLPRDRFAGVLLFLFWSLVLGSVWADPLQPALLTIAAVLLVVHWTRLFRVKGSDSESVATLTRELRASAYRDRERGIHRAAESRTQESRRLLIERLSEVDASEDEEELMTIIRALLDGWGPAALIDAWSELPAQSRMDFLEFARGNARFPHQELLPIARRGMRDKHEAIGRLAWRTYAYTVTSAVDNKREDFDFTAWLADSESDPDAEIQGLRCRLEQKRVAETQNLGLDSLLTRYRAEVFKSARPTAVTLGVAQPTELDLDGGGELRLPQGSHSGSLSGSFDSAQDVVHDGWVYRLELDDLEGRRACIEATWSSESFFGEILDSRHDDRRCWFEEAPDEVVRAFSLQPFVGPVVAYGDAWDLYAPCVDGERLQPEERQILKCIIAVGPAADEQESRLAFLLYEIEDAANDGDEIRPFVTTIGLSRWLLEPDGEDPVDGVIAKLL